MTTDIMNVLRERGFIEQVTHENELNEYLKKEKIVCYIGFDPTADSLHVGSLMPIMALAHMQRCGHIPIALIGGGTGLVGDPSGKTETRQLLEPKIVENNVDKIKEQLTRFIDKALLLNNADWLTGLKYIPFLMDIGRHFSVNRMVKAESYKMRLASNEGLNFIEFNYMLLQSYDFLELFDKYECRLQMGGSDQWGNIVSGIELVRKVRHKSVFGITFSLVTTSNGVKMGKTVKGAVWLDPKKTTPYEYYQYWINTDDKDVLRFIALFTFLPMNEIKAIEKLEGAELNNAKMILAYEATLLAHGRGNAEKVYLDSIKVFGSKVIPKDITPSSAIHFCKTHLEDISIPHSYINIVELKKGMPAFKIFHMVGLAKSNGASRRLIEQGGAYVNGKRISSFDYLLTDKDIDKMGILLRAGKKKFHKIKVKNDDFI